MTLKGAARTWFRSLPLGSVDGFRELSCLFLTQFMVSRRRRRPAAYLLTVEQREDENLKAHLSQFNQESMITDDQDEKITLAALLEVPRRRLVEGLVKRDTRKSMMDKGKASRMQGWEKTHQQGRIVEAKLTRA
ncbi:hypothetical protein F2P56_004106 [Juglans regia]|uniref:Uncharacterized protein LOC108986961 n=2 Tax=Juglans regia TaxID=51240 RepID=A0A2I4E7E9_JUGRE|nr:uncharacterized protein LOC108986961 [Juglans regia]KAF5477469.1 hypothetical protein F2P56_004106 [Juglans regia]